MFPFNDGKKIEKYRPSASQKNVNASPLVKLIENVQQTILVTSIKKTAPPQLNIFFSHHH